MIYGGNKINPNQIIAQQYKNLRFKAAGVILVWVLTALALIGTLYVSKIYVQGLKPKTSTYHALAVLGCSVAACGTIASVAGLYWFFNVISGNTDEQKKIANARFQTQKRQLSIQ